jgi:hypothetical protein
VPVCFASLGVISTAHIIKPSNLRKLRFSLSDCVCSIKVSVTFSYWKVTLLWKGCTWSVLPRTSCLRTRWTHVGSSGMFHGCTKSQKTSLKLNQLLNRISSGSVVLLCWLHCHLQHSNSNGDASIRNGVTDLCKIWVLTDVTMKNEVFWDRKTQFVPHRRHYVSATEPTRLMLCKVWGFHGVDCEECRLLGYKNPVHTLQEAHYVSPTEPSRLILFKVWGFHDWDY